MVNVVEREMPAKLRVKKFLKDVGFFNKNNLNVDNKSVGQYVYTKGSQFG